MGNLLSNLCVPVKTKRPLGDVDTELDLQGAAQAGFHGFFEQVSEIEKLLDTFTVLLKDLQNANEESKGVTKASTAKEIKKRIKKHVNKVIEIARLGKSKLQQLKKDNLANREKTSFGKGSAVDRYQTLHIDTLTRMLRERISEFLALREAIQMDYRKVVERRVFNVTGEHADEGTIDKLIETGESERIYQRAIEDQWRGRVLDTLKDIQERHATMKGNEMNLLELQQIFLDLSVLVDAQCEMVNNIKAQVEDASEHVHDESNLL